MTLAESFLAGWGGDRTRVDAARLEEALAGLVKRGQDAHPGVKVSAETLAGALSAQVKRGEDPLEALAPLHVADLYLACAALGGDRRAAEELDRLIATAAGEAARMDRSPAFLDDLKQQLRERLLVGSRDGGPRLADYGGRGALLSWIRVVAVRLAINAKAGAEPEREVELEPEALIELDPRDPERQAVHRAGMDQLKRAFSRAVASLEPDERMLLRYQVVDHLNFEQMAALFSSHRSTISRRVAATREKLLELTRQILHDSLEVPSGELSSILRLAPTHLDVSLHQLLREDE
jgi:RNA polymerase sigma-70 factor (ECF subfamily)